MARARGRRRGGRVRRAACGCAEDARARRRSPTSTRSSRAHRARPTSSTPTSQRDAAMTERASARRPRQAYAGLLWSQAVLSLRRRALARGRPGAAAAARAAQARPQPRLAAPVHRDVHRRCPTSGSTRGSRRGTWRSTCCRDGALRSAVREGAAPAAAARVVHAPERPAPRLRVRASATSTRRCTRGPCWRVYKMTGEAGHARPRVPRARVPQAADQLHLVGQPQGRRGQQPLRRRLPRPRQHRRLRPLAAAAGGRQPRAGRRHRLDGVLLRDHAVDGARARAATDPAYEDIALEVLRALRRDRRRDEHASAARACGTRRTASTTTSCTLDGAADPAARCARWSG